MFWMTSTQMDISESPISREMKKEKGSKYL
jgi:hypothetical protein